MGSEYLQLIEHQKDAIRVLLKNPQCALFALPGTGKTAVALSILKILDCSALVVAPLATATTTWPNEINRWVQLSRLEYGVAHGSKKERAFDKKITIINPAGLKWLFANQHLLKDKETLIVDESTFFKSWSSKTTKIMRKLAPLFERRHIMTGTPVPKTLLAWFPQQFIVDLGVSFGDKITHFQKKYFYPGGFKNYEWVPFDSTSEKMSELAKGRFHVAENKTLQTPGLHFVDIKVEMTKEAKQIYKEMQRSLVTSVEGDEITALDLRQKYLKLRQIASGGVYAEENGSRKFNIIHKAKIERLAQLVEEYSRPVVVGYMYDFELFLLREAFKKYKTAEINGHASKVEKIRAQNRWEEGKLDLLFVHPKSGGHGLNLHHGGRCLVHLSLPDDPELYEQFNARIDRIGADSAGLVYRFLVTGTVEPAVLLPRLLRRGEMQKELIQHCKEAQEEKRQTFQ